MTAETKSRTTRGFRVSGRGRVVRKYEKVSGGYSDPRITDSPASPVFKGSQITVTENHPDWLSREGKPFRDIGGSFRTEKKQGKIPMQNFAVLHDRPINDGTYKREIYEISGECCAPIEYTSTGAPKWPTSLRSDTTDLIGMGATAISRCKPTSSAGELMTAMGETAREGLPSIPASQTWQRRLAAQKAVGSEYLNVKFGWQPLLSEITTLASQIAKSRDILEQYRADLGKPVRRRYDFPLEETESWVDLGDWFARTNAGVSASWFPSNTKGRLIKTISTSKRTWFSGAFIYGVPQTHSAFGAIRSKAAELDRLTGLSLTPDVLWNLSPWSWAVDWFSNTGDVLSNVSDYMSQGLAMQYGYIMEETVHRWSYSLTGAAINGKPVNPPAAVLTTTSKQRLKASPFGFDVTWEGLNPAQAVILAALGMSRS